MKPTQTWCHLIGLPWKEGGWSSRTGLDCWGVVQEVYSRAGLPVPTLPDQVDRAAFALPDGVTVSDCAGLNPQWRRVEEGEPFAEYDVVISQPYAGQSAMHASVVVELGTPLVITSTRQGGVHLHRYGRIRNPIGVYRLA